MVTPPVEQWRWMIRGLDGLAGMLEGNDRGPILCPPDQFAELLRHWGRLSVVIANQKRKASPEESHVP